MLDDKYPLKRMKLTCAKATFCPNPAGPLICILIMVVIRSQYHEDIPIVARVVFRLIFNKALASCDTDR